MYVVFEVCSFNILFISYCSKGLFLYVCCFRGVYFPHIVYKLMFQRTLSVCVVVYQVCSFNIFHYKLMFQRTLSVCVVVYQLWSFNILFISCSRDYFSVYGYFVFIFVLIVFFNIIFKTFISVIVVFVFITIFVNSWGAIYKRSQTNVEWTKPINSLESSKLNYMRN